MHPGHCGARIIISTSRDITLLRRHLRKSLRRTVVLGERAIDAAVLARHKGRPPSDLTIVPYLGHGNPDRVLVHGRVLDGREPSAAEPGEDSLAALRRSLSRFITEELPGVALLIRIAGAEVETVTDEEGFFRVHIPLEGIAAQGPWVEGRVELAAPYRGTTDTHATSFRVRLPEASAAFGVISDIDDTILQTGAQRVVQMVRQTLLGSALTRVPFDGAAALYRALVAGKDGERANPVFYVSSSPWNLHGFLTEFLAHRGFPLGPLMLRELYGREEGRTHASAKHERIEEILGLHGDLPFVLIGDSGQHDPEIYAEVVQRNPGRILAIYIREVRLDPGDGRVEAVQGDWKVDVPFMVAADSIAVARHAATIGLIDPAAVGPVEQAVADEA